MSQEIDDMFSSDLKDLANPSRVKLAEAEKTAVVGPLLEAVNLGIPSGIGYAIGANKTPVNRDEARRQLDSGYSVGKGLLVPGYTGYRAGKNSAAREMLRAAESKKKKGKKEAALADEIFAAELCQAVGLDVPEAYVDFQRPQVKIAGSASDAIDNHFRSWMQEKAGEDVVKVAMCGADHKKLKPGAKCEKCGEMRKEAADNVQPSRLRMLMTGNPAVRKKAMQAADSVFNVTNPEMAFVRDKLTKKQASDGSKPGAGESNAMLTRHMKKKFFGPGFKTVGMTLVQPVNVKSKVEKQAGVIEHDENLDLLAKIRARAAQGLGLNGDG